MKDLALDLWRYFCDPNFVTGQDHNCRSQVWFDDHVLLVGTSEATILVLEDGDFQTKLNINDTELKYI